jgi:hypothetical protein
VLNTGVNANWLLTGQGEMFTAESNAVETGMQEIWAIYQRLGDKEKVLLLESGAAQNTKFIVICLTKIILVVILEARSIWISRSDCPK